MEDGQSAVLAFYAGAQNAHKIFHDVPGQLVKVKACSDGHDECQINAILCALLPFTFNY